MRYALSRVAYVDREESYRIYVSDALNGIIGNKGTRYADIWKKKEERSAQDIIGGIRAKIGRKDGSI